MEIVSGQVITGESVHLDDKHFINCTLNDCELGYGGGGVIFEGTLLTKCHHVFYGPARATVLYLQNVGLLAAEVGTWTELSESVN